MGDRTLYSSSVLKTTVSILEIHKWEPDIYIGFSPALHLQCTRLRGKGWGTQFRRRNRHSGTLSVYYNPSTVSMHPSIHPSIFFQFVEHKKWISRNFPKERRFEFIIAKSNNILTADNIKFVSIISLFLRLYKIFLCSIPVCMHIII
jgi:hypothetical protein